MNEKIIIIYIIDEKKKEAQKKNAWDVTFDENQS